MASRLRLSQNTIDRYRDWLTLGHRRFDAEAKPVIERMRAYFMGNQWPNTGGDVEMRRLVVNLIFADIKVMLPTLALRNPRIFVKPTGATVQIPTMVQGPDGMPMPGPGQPAQIVNGQPVPLLSAARAKENLINWRWRDLRVTKQVRRCLIDALTSWAGIMKLGYTVTTEKVAGDGELLESNELIKAEAPYAVRWSPMDFRVDPEARYPDLSDARWIAFGWKDRIRNIQKNSRFRNTRDLRGTVDVRTDYTMGTDGPGVSGSDLKTYTTENDDWRLVQLWEIWHKDEGKRIVLADDHDKALEYVDWPIIHKGFPCKTLVFTEHPDTLYGPPDLYQVLDQQNVYNEIASMIANHVHRFVRKYVANRGAFDQKELDKLKQPVDGLIVMTDGEADRAIKPLDDASIPVDWWQARANVRDDQDRVSGIADFVRGVAEKVDTATEASLLQSNLNVRTNDTRDIVETFAEEIAAELLFIDAQTLEIPRAIPVIGPDGAYAFNEFVNVQTRETLLAQSDVEIEVGSMQPVNEMTRKKDALEIYTLWRNDPLIKQVPLRKMLLPAYHNSIPDLGQLVATEEEARLIMMQMQAAQGGGGGSAPQPQAKPAPAKPPLAQPQGRPPMTPAVPNSAATPTG